VHEDFVINQLAQNAQPQVGRLLSRGLLLRAGGLVLVVLLDVRIVDLASIDRGRDVAASRFRAAAGAGEQ
jgi:hypothetical protein